MIKVCKVYHQKCFDNNDGVNLAFIAAMINVKRCGITCIDFVVDFHVAYT